MIRSTVQLSGTVPILMARYAYLDCEISETFTPDLDICHSAYYLHLTCNKSMDFTIDYLIDPSIHKVDVTCAFVDLTALRNVHVVLSIGTGLQGY